MSEVKLRELLAQTRVDPQIDIEGLIEDGVYRILSQKLLPEHPELEFVKTPSIWIPHITWTRFFLGESIQDIVTIMENSFPIIFCAVPTSEGGFLLYLDEKAKAM